MAQGCNKYVTRALQGCNKDVTRVSQGLPNAMERSFVVYSHVMTEPGAVITTASCSECYRGVTKGRLTQVIQK
jgi:hypothetical protein